MPLPRSQVVHVWLKVLDDTALICGGKILPRVAELHRADSAVMRLQDCLKVECEAIPQREFATCRASQDATSLWCPLGEKSVDQEA